MGKLSAWAWSMWMGRMCESLQLHDEAVLRARRGPLQARSATLGSPGHVVMHKRAAYCEYTCVLMMTYSEAAVRPK